MQKAIFIDKDGTLIPDIRFNVKPELIIVDDKVTSGLKKLAGHGYLKIIITNQTGIAYGYYTEQELAIVQAHILQLLMADDIKIDGFYFCPHSPGAFVKRYDLECDCMKPLPGMLLKAARDFNIDLRQSWMIGDILNDVEAGNRAGCRSVLINNGNETEWITGPDDRAPYFIAKDMEEAVDFILNNSEVISTPSGHGKHVLIENNEK